MSTSKGRGAAAHTIAEVIPPEQLRFLFLRPRPNQAIEFDPGRAPTRSRACSTSSTSSPRRRPAARSRASSRPGYEATFRYSLLDPDADVAAEAAAFRPAFAHLALLVQIPGVDVAGPGRGGEGEPADRARDGRSSTSASRPRAPGSRPTPRSARGSPSGTRRCRPRPPALEPDAARVPRARSPIAAETTAADRRRRLAGRDLRGRQSTPDVPARSCVRRALPRVPRPDERPARRLAARQPRPGVRRRAAARGRRRGARRRREVPA